MGLVLNDNNKKLTIQQMDSNLKYLESIGIGDINYSSNIILDESLININTLYIIESYNIKNNIITNTKIYTLN